MYTYYIRSIYRKVTRIGCSWRINIILIILAYKKKRHVNIILIIFARQVYRHVNIISIIVALIIS